MQYFLCLVRSNFFCFVKTFSAGIAHFKCFTFCLSVYHISVKFLWCFCCFWSSSSFQCTFEGIYYFPDILSGVHWVHWYKELSLILLFSQAVCSVLRTPLASIDYMSVQLPDHDASKVKWSLECYSGKAIFPCSYALFALVCNHHIL